MKIDKDLSYSKDHLWVRKIADGQYQAGITDYAQDLLGIPSSWQCVTGQPAMRPYRIC